MRIKNNIVLKILLLIGFVLQFGFSNGQCIYVSDSAQINTFDIGYRARFETVGSNVNISFELLDTNKIGIVAYLWEQSPFVETPMTFISGQTWGITLSGQTGGQVLSLGCKFAYAGGLSVTRYFSYVVGDNCIPDTLPPTNFTASVGAVSAFSVEILMNGIDSSGTLQYVIDDGLNRDTVNGISGVQTSHTFYKLTPLTTYSYTVEAYDLAGNAAANNPIPLSATTTADSSTACEGESYLAQQGNFSAGYTYKFETVGTSVICTFELFDDDKVGLVAFLWEQVPFVETPMNLVSGRTYSLTLTNQTVGQPISLACKFAYAGGLSVTNYFPYTVGDSCATNTVIGDTIPPFNFTATAGAVSEISIELLMNGEDDSGHLFYLISHGNNVTTIKGDSAVQESVVFNKLVPDSTYTFFVEARDSSGNNALNNPIQLDITTLPDSSNDCSGITYEASEGDFEVGYTYEFETIGSDVKFTFELLDDVTGVTATLVEQLPFNETVMTLESGNRYSTLLSNQSVGQNIVLACKFEFPSNRIITKYFIYKVGDKCDGSSIIDLSTSSTLENLKIYPNPTHDIIYVDYEIAKLDKVEILSLDGRVLLEQTNQVNLMNLSDLERGVYVLKVYSGDDILVDKISKF